MTSKRKEGLWLVREGGDSYAEVYTNKKQLTEACRYMTEGAYDFTVYDLSTASEIPVVVEQVPAQLTVELLFPTSDSAAGA